MAADAGTVSFGDRAIHPGQFLGEELDARGMTQKDLAEEMGRPVKTMNEIVRGKKSITADTALDLERVLGSSARTWMRLQADYELALAHIRRRKVS